MSVVETTVYNEDNVLVTTSRLVINGQTYAMSGITSVQFLKESPSKKRPISLLAIGAIIGFFGLASGLGLASFIGLATAVIGIYLLMLQKEEYSVRLATASGESRDLKSESRERVASVVDAINEAIIQRG